MKLNLAQPVLIGALATALGVAGYLWINKPAVDAPEATPLMVSPAAAPEGERDTTADHEAVFKRAFWRRPAADDVIVNAQRSEWKQDGTEVSRWQWFIEVEPSVELKDWLQQKNPFSLTKSDVVQLPTGATAPPEWFPTAAREFEIYRSNDKSMNLLFSREGNRLFASASGYGFARGAAQPVVPVLNIETTGRLPLTPPPTSPQP